MTETELEKKWRKVFELALNESDGRVSLKINEEPDGWVTVRSFTAPTYKTPYKGEAGLAEFAQQIARELLYVKVTEHGQLVLDENRRRATRLKALQEASKRLAEVFTVSNAAVAETIAKEKNPS